MAIVDDRDFEGLAPVSQAATRVQWFVNVAGAVTSVGLLFGVAIWGYKLAVRDVTGIPVVRALEGRCASPRRNRAVRLRPIPAFRLNEVAAEGAAAPLPEQMVLAPRPIDLAEEDQPAAALAAVTAPPETQTLAALTVTNQPAPRWR